MFKWEPKSESVLVDTIGVAKAFSVKIFFRRPSTWKMLSGKSRATVFVVSLTLASIKFFCWLIFIVDFCFVQSQFLPLPRALLKWIFEVCCVMNLGFLYVRVGAGVGNYFSSREWRVARHSNAGCISPDPGVGRRGLMKWE